MNKKNYERNNNKDSFMVEREELLLDYNTWKVPHFTTNKKTVFGASFIWLFSIHKNTSIEFNIVKMEKNTNTHKRTIKRDKNDRRLYLSSVATMQFSIDDLEMVREKESLNQVCCKLKVLVVSKTTKKMCKI